MFPNLMKNIYRDIVIIVDHDVNLHGGKGFVKEIPKIRADQIRTLSDENLGRFICKEFMHGACGNCRFDVHVTVPIDKHICTLQEWLKEKSNE